LAVVRPLLVCSLLWLSGACELERKSGDQKEADSKGLAADGAFASRQRLGKAEAIRFTIQVAYLDPGLAGPHTMEYSDANLVRRAIDVATRAVSSELGPYPGEIRHRLELVGTKRETLFEVRFVEVSELRRHFRVQEDADFIAGLFRRAGKEALAKSKKRGEEE
jgi:hypothetical protein